jgi:hypothetical protein
MLTIGRNLTRGFGELAKLKEFKERQGEKIFSQPGWGGYRPPQLRLLGKLQSEIGPDSGLAANQQVAGALFQPMLGIQTVLLMLLISRIYIREG